MELMLIESQASSFINTIQGLDDKEKQWRKTAVLNLITEIYDKHQEEITVQEAYEILGFSDERV